jgi:3-oxoacyl-[acyl-carrier protein] reductase
MDLKLKDLTVVVTGGSSGIGAAIVRSFLEEGAHVAFCSRSESKIEAMLASLDKKLNVSVKALDVTDRQEFSAWIKSLSKVDIFIPNVSALSGVWEEAIDVDLNATVNNIEVVLPYLEKSTFGAITYIGSKASSFPTPGLDAYGAVKIAMTHYMKTLENTEQEINF